jgi:hypothetical protein
VFLRDSGEEAAVQIDELATGLAGPDVPDESYLERRAG